MNPTTQTISPTDIIQETTPFLKRYPRFTQLMRWLRLVEDSPAVASRSQTVAAQVENVLEKTPAVLIQEEVNALLFAARKSMNEKGVTMSVSDQNKFFTLCYSLYLKENTIVVDNPRANIEPLRKYLAMIGTNVSELEILCGIKPKV